MKTLFAIVITALSLLAQDGQPVSISRFPSYVADDSINYVDGSGNLIYRCVAKSQTVQSTVTVSAISNANPASFTATDHGFGDFATHGATMTPVVRVSGLTGAWSVLNGVWKATVTSANAFTLPVNSTAFGAVAGTVAVTTVAPRWNRAVWSIWGAVYAGTTFIFSGWAAAPAGAGSINLTAGSTGGNKTCSLRTGYAYQ